MFSHIMIGSNDIAWSKKFYDALFAAMGAQPGVEDARGRLAYSSRSRPIELNGYRFLPLASGSPRMFLPIAEIAALFG